MRSHFLFAASVLSIALAGCQHDETVYVQPAAQAPAPNNPVAQQDIYNRAALSAFPMQVRTAFERDYPDAAVSQAQLMPTESAPPLYKVVFIQDGRPRSVMYDRAGTIVEPPSAALGSPTESLTRPVSPESPPTGP